MQHSKFTDTHPIEYRFVLKDKMAKTVSLKSTRASIAKPNTKPLPRDKTLGIDPVIFFYEIEDGNNTDEGEVSEIFFIQESSLAASKKNLVKSQFP